MTELEAYLDAFAADWINAGQPGPTVTIAMAREIDRLRAALELIADGAGDAQTIARIALGQVS